MKKDYKKTIKEDKDMGNLQEMPQSKAFEEIERDMQEWKQLINDNKKLKEEYKSLVAEMRAMKETAIKATFGNKLRYKIARWLTK